MINTNAKKVKKEKKRKTEDNDATAGQHIVPLNALRIGAHLFAVAAAELECAARVCG